MTDGGRVNDAPGQPHGAACFLCGGRPVDSVSPFPGRSAVCRSCFIAWDDRQVALESLELVPRMFAPDPDPDLRRVVELEDLRGRRFGQLQVERVVVRRRRNGWVERLWACRCACGREATVSASRLRQGTSSCRPCANAATARGRQPRFNGATVLELAARSGLPTATIWTRIRRGVPVELLTAPPKRPPTIGNSRRAAA